MCNFTDQEAVYEIPKDLWERTGKVLISNYGREETGLESAEGKIVLGPYEAAALLYS